MPYTPGEVNQESVILVDIEVAHRIDEDAWTQADAPNTDAWWIPHTHADKFGEHEGEPARIEANGTELTEVADPAACHAMASSWYFDSTTKRLYVHVADDGDPGDGGYIIAAYLWRRFGSQAYVFGGKPYLPLVGKNSIPPVAYVTGGYQEGGTKQTFGSLKFMNGEKYFDTDLTDYIYEGKRTTARIGKNGAADADFAVFWDGWTGDITWTENEVEITVEDLMTGVI